MPPDDVYAIRTPVRVARSSQPPTRTALQPSRAPVAIHPEVRCTPSACVCNPCPLSWARECRNDTTLSLTRYTIVAASVHCDNRRADDPKCVRYFSQAARPLEPFNKGSLPEVTMRQDSRTTLGSPNPAYIPPSGPMNIKRRGYTTNPEGKPSLDANDAKPTRSQSAACHCRPRSCLPTVEMDGRTLTRAAW